MRCPSCGFENPEGMKFCGQCASSLSPHCPHCGFENPPGFVFCGQCAAPLTEQPSAPKTPESRLQTLDFSRPEAERRQLTVMFCDLVGSTPLSEKLDPEELREVVRAYQEVCAEVIGRFEGHIAQYLGDGLLVYFGYPLAHEDDAQRAARTGLGILAELQQLNTRLHQTVSAMQEWPLRVRIGIHTGLVVVGEMGRGGDRDPMVIVGETPNIAARVQETAEPNTVAISAATYRLTQGFFECLDLGPQKLKGVSTPVEVYHVLGESGVQSRLEVAATRGLTPLVGREQEVKLLLGRWEGVKEGMGQVVLLSGEAGIGKSRLVQVLKERVAEKDHIRLECRCSPYYQHSAFYPVIDLVQRALQFSREDSPQEKLSKLEEALARHPFSLQEVVPLLASLLSLPLLGRYSSLTFTPQRQRQKTLEVLLAVLLSTAEKRPLLLVVEDLQWVDPSTLEFLSLLVDQGPTAPILTLLTFRPEFSLPWAIRSHMTQITLSRLPRKQAKAMVERVAGGKHLPPEVLGQVVAKTDGVPLFVEELTKMVLESGLLRERDSHYELVGPLPLLAIPTTLQDSLMARLDRLGTVKETAQLGAILGREFPYELIQVVSPLDEATLQEGLARLVEVELLYQKGLPPQAQYLFKHALIQEAAYQSLLKSKRQQYHQQIVEVLAEQFPEIAETQPELLAHHYTEAGLIAQAIPYWQRAGQRALQRSANEEAISHFTKGLELLKTLPNTPARTQQELFLQTALGSAFMATKGFAAPEVERAYAQALELCQQVGEPPQLGLVLRGLAAFYYVRAEFQTALELGEQCLDLAQRQQDLALLLGARLELGGTLYSLGEFAPALEHLEQGITLYDDPQKYSSHIFLYGQDLGGACLCSAALVLWMLGYPDQAFKKSQKALTLAQELSHPHSQAQALSYTAALHQLRREGQATQERAEAARTLSTEQGFPIWEALGTVLRGWALVEQGQREEGIAQMRQGLATYRATGAEVAQPYVLALLAEAYRKVGQAEDGLRVLAEALAAVDKTGERSDEAELYRLKGELTLQQFKVQGSKFKVASPQHPTPSPQAEAEAEACFLKALDIARRQQAKSLELRAVMSLSRLWQSQGKKEEARQMLAAIYGWFTEGFDTVDLREARVLLAEGL